MDIQTVLADPGGVLAQPVAEVAQASPPIEAAVGCVRTSGKVDTEP